MLDDLTSHHANVFKKHSWQNNNEVQVVQICTFLQAHNPRDSASPEFFQVLKKKTTQICFAYLAETGLELQVVQNKRAAHSCWSPPPSGRRRGQSEERCWSVRGLGECWPPTQNVFLPPLRPMPALLSSPPTHRGSSQGSTASLRPEICSPDTDSQTAPSSQRRMDLQAGSQSVLLERELTRLQEGCWSG